MNRFPARGGRLVLALAVCGATIAALATAGFGEVRAASVSPFGRLVFNGTFPGRSLNTSLWRTCYDFGSCRIPTNAEYEWYAPSGVSVANGTLELTARQQTTKGEPFSSGMIQSNGRFEFKYGYVEIRAKVPSGYGTWPALWLLPADGSWPPEIDIMEAWGSSPDEIRQSLFTPLDRAGIHHTVVVPRLSSAWHTFGLDWEPTTLSWYVDGRLEFRLDASIDTLMYPIANLAVADPPSPLTAHTFPASFQIEYIRVYQHSGVGQLRCTAGCPRG